MKRLLLLSPSPHRNTCSGSRERGPDLFIFLLIALPARSGQHRRWRHQTLKHSLGFPSRRVTPITFTDHHRLNSLASQCKSINMEMVEEEVLRTGELPAGKKNW